MSSPDQWGFIKTGTDLENAARNTLRTWVPTYLREIELQKELGTSGVLPLPQSYLVAEELDQQQGNELPAIVLLSPGLSGNRPMQEGDGTIRAYFHLGIGVLVAANNSENTKRMVRLYTAVVRAIMLQKQSLGDFANGVTWLDESYDDKFPFPDNLTISAGQVLFEVDVPDVTNRFGGPINPDTPPGSAWGTVTSAEIEVNPTEDLP